MIGTQILSDWDGAAAARFGKAPLRLAHGLAENPLFSRSTLEALIETYPRQHYGLVETGRAGGERRWREGDFGRLSGADVLDAIAAGRMWLNLRNLSTVDARYGALLDQLLAEFAREMPGFKPNRKNCGLLISSPHAEVYYHADLPGQMLMQISGKKRVRIWPAEAPYLTPQQLEDIAVFDLEVGLPYDRSYDKAAQVFDLEPGQMLHWPLNGPHRVENYGMLNISLTVSYQTEEIRRAETVHLANGMLRHAFGWTARSRAISGPGFWAKVALQKAMRKSGWLARMRKARQAITFRLDAAHKGAIVDVKEAA
jgi:hypothetical protein